MQVMIIPSRQLLIALTAWLALGIATAYMPVLALWSNLAGIALLAWAGADALLARRQPHPAVQRVLNHTLPVGEWSPVEVRLHWGSAVPRHFRVYDHHPDGFMQEGLPATVQSTGNDTYGLRYRIRPLLRGDHAFGKIALRVTSPWRAWQTSMQLGEKERVRVYPNFAPLAGHALKAVDYRNARFGMQQRRRRGQGMDFAQLREYREGDSMRQIDWKATTRMGKMISREYQDERDQRILLVLDCGRRMGAKDGDLSHFDHALDTLLMLAYVALNHGDRVGLMTLGGPDRYLPVQHAPSTVAHILRETYDLQPSMQVSDFEHTAERLLVRERKRALVVILTNLRDEDDQSLVAAARLLGKRHLVLVASLRETALDHVQSEPVSTAHDAARLASAVGYARRRETCLRRLRAEGVLCLDTTPENLAIETVNRYLAVKAASQL